MGSGILAYFYFQRQRAETYGAVHESLVTISSLKAAQIERWRADLLADAEALLADPVTARRLRTFVSGPRTAQESEALRTWLSALERTYKYRSVTLLDREDHVWLSAGEGGEDVGGYGSENARRAEETGRPLLSDLHSTPAAPYPHVDLVVPIPVEEGEKGSRGAILLRIDSENSLYPLIRTWPSPSTSGEIFLVRRERDRVLYLTGLRFRAGTALKLVLPMDSPLLPAALAARGTATYGHGKDYRGADVEFATRSVEGTPWGLVAKVDTQEIEAPLRQLGRRVAFVAVLLIMTSGWALFAIWRQNEGQRLKAQFESDRERAALVQHFDFSARYANDMIILADASGRISEMNDSVLQGTGTLGKRCLAGPSPRRGPSRRARCWPISCAGWMRRERRACASRRRSCGRTGPLFRRR